MPRSNKTLSLEFPVIAEFQQIRNFPDLLRHSLDLRRSLYSFFKFIYRQVLSAVKRNFLLLLLAYIRPARRGYESTLFPRKMSNEIYTRAQNVPHSYLDCVTFSKRRTRVLCFVPPRYAFFHVAGFVYSSSRLFPRTIRAQTAIRF